MSLKNLRAKSDEALAGIPESEVEKQLTASRPTTAPGAMAFMQPALDSLNERAETAEARVAQLESELELVDQPRELPVDQLQIDPHRKRNLTLTQFAELKANLENNPLVHPITVRPVGDGLYEVVSGHNRLEAFRQLGRKSIPVVILDIADASVDRTAFYANLLQPELPDFEKYLGFREERNRTNATQKEMAKAAGILESVVSTLFAFDNLPERAIDLIAEKPEIIGMSCAAALAKLTKAGKGDKVVEVVELLFEEKLTQKEAVQMASRTERMSAPRAASSPVKIRSGRQEFCQYQSRGGTLRIDFKEEDARAEAEKLIVEVLKKLAEPGSDGA